MPTKERWYKVIVPTMNRYVKMNVKFKRGKNGPREYYPDGFIHKKRYPIVLFWKEKNENKSDLSYEYKKRRS